MAARHRLAAGVIAAALTAGAGGVALAAVRESPPRAATPTPLAGQDGESADKAADGQVGATDPAESPRVPGAAATAEPHETPRATDKPEPATTPEAAETPEPSDTPEATETPRATTDEDAGGPDGGGDTGDHSSND